MTFKLLVTTFGALCFATAVSAQTVGHKGTDVTFGYDSWDVSVFGSDVGSGDTKIARVRTDWGLGASFGVQANLDYASFSFDLSPSSSVKTFALHPYMEFGSAGRAGVFLQRSNFEFGIPSLDYYGVEGMFTPTPEMALEIYVGRGTSDFIPGDATAYGVTLHYALGESLGMHMAYDHETIDAGGSDFNNSRFNVGVDYYLNTGGSMPPVVLTAEAGTVDMMGFFDLTVVGAKITIPLGGTAGNTGRKLFRERGLFWAAQGGIFGP